MEVFVVLGRLSAGGLSGQHIEELLSEGVVVVVINGDDVKGLFLHKVGNKRATRKGRQALLPLRRRRRQLGG